MQLPVVKFEPTTPDLETILQSKNEPRHEISNNVVCAINKASDQSDQNLCLSLEYSMNIKLPTKHHLEFLNLKEGCTGSSESIHVKMPHCCKSHVMAQISSETDLLPLLVS